MIALIQGRRPSRPLESVSLHLGLDDHMWNLIEDCWDTDPTKRPNASEVVNRISSRPDLPEDNRGPCEWDTDFPYILRTSLDDHMICPSMEAIRKIIDNQGS